jgi:phosphatidylinositol alpha-mannosyltransferase
MAGLRIAMTHIDLPNQARGGVAFQVHYLANALVERGHDVTMFTFSPAYAECRYRVHQYARVPRQRRLWRPVLAARFARTDFSRFDILHTNGDNFLLWGRHPQLRTFYGAAWDEAAAAATLRARVYYGVTTLLELIGARVADVNVGISEATRARIPRIAAIVPCGVDTHRFRPGPKAGKPAVLFVGTAGGRKRGAFLAEIFEHEVRPRFPDAELWAVSDRPLDGAGVVNFGRVPLETLTQLYQRAWVFCLPSRYEGFGIPYIEALAAGTAVVASPNPGAREVLADGRFGVLAEDARLGEGLNLLLGDEPLRSRYAEQGLDRAQEFAWQRVVQQYEAIYASLALGRLAL